MVMSININDKQWKEHYKHHPEIKEVHNRQLYGVINNPKKFFGLTEVMNKNAIRSWIEVAIALEHWTAVTVLLKLLNIDFEGLSVKQNLALYRLKYQDKM